MVFCPGAAWFVTCGGATDLDWQGAVLRRPAAQPRRPGHERHAAEGHFHPATPPGRNQTGRAVFTFRPANDILDW
jgi:hypothetical protein